MAKLLRKRNTGSTNEIDLTPMLDVVFIMLIFFIVTASFVQEVGFDVTRPPPSPPNNTPTEAKNAVFTISDSNKIELNGLQIDPRSARARIEQILAENPKASIIVSSHPKADARYYIAIVDAAYEVNPSKLVSLIATAE